MKRAIFSAIFVGIVALAAWTQPKVAVLDAIIPQNMDPSVIVPVTEKIVERLVVSGRFTVLDRANIESVLKEREFQISGMVSDQDVVTAGKYLGADFVVVAKVTKVSDTYFISAKMIAIKTGVIANQTSAQGEGKLSTLITIAEQVGEVLSGGAVLAQSAAGGQQDISKADGSAKPRPQPKPAAPASNNAAAIGVSYVPLSWVKKGKGYYAAGTYTENYSYVIFGASYSSRYYDLGLSYGTTVSGSWTDKDYSVAGTTDTGTFDFKESFLDLNAYGKYPFYVGGMDIYPLVGLECILNLDVKDSSGSLKSSMSDSLKSSFNRLFLQGGVGLSYPLSSSLFTRVEALFGYKILASTYDADVKANAETNGYTNVKIVETMFRIGASVGIKF